MMRYGKSLRSLNMKADTLPCVKSPFNKEFRNSQKKANYIPRSFSVKSEQNPSKQNLSKLFSFLTILVKQYNLKGIRTITDKENPNHKIFSLKIPENLSLKERRQLRSKISEDYMDFAEKEGIYDTAMDTSIFLER